MVQKAQRLARVVTFDPERHFAQVDRQGILVDRVDAFADHVTYGVAEGGRRRLLFTGADARQFAPQPPGRGEQEMAGAGGGIDGPH